MFGVSVDYYTSLERCNANGVSESVLHALAAFTAEPGSKSEKALNLLGSWVATLDQAEMPEQAETAHATDGS